MVSMEYSEAMVEVLDILEHSENNIIEKIPAKLIEFWKRNKSTTYESNLDHSKELNEMILQDKTKDIITMIYLNYLCDENEKENLKGTLYKNEKNYQSELRDKYNPDNIFNNEKNEKVRRIEDQNKQEVILITEEKWYSRIINFIKNIFMRKKG